LRLLIGLFSAPTGTWGGLTRGLAVADAARRRGHQVHVAASGPVATPLRTRGEQVHDLPAATVLGLPEPVSRRFQQRSQRTRLPVREGRGVGSIWLVLTFSGFASRSYLRRATDAYLDLVDQIRPDVLLTDLDPHLNHLLRFEGGPAGLADQRPRTRRQLAHHPRLWSPSFVGGPTFGGPTRSTPVGSCDPGRRPVW
jgi:hypothetical protein